MLKRITLIFMLLTFGSMAFAQDFQKIFDDFHKNIQKDFESFADKANKQYAEFLRKSWEWFEGQEPITPPVNKEPVVPPVVLPEEDLEKDRDDREIPYIEVVPEPLPSPMPTPIEPIDDEPVPLADVVDIEFYGTKCTVHFNPDVEPHLTDVSEESIAGFWETLVDYDGTYNTLYDIYNQRKSMRLCDWAYNKFVKTFSNAVYPENTDEANLLYAFIMTQSGFKLKIGIDEAGSLYPLMAVECDLYSYPYFVISGQKYYLLEEKASCRMRIIQDSFSAEMQPMRIAIEQENLFAEQLSSERTLVSKRYPETALSTASNLNLISFFNEYPLAFVNNDMRTKWRFYANVPASHNMKESVYPVLKQAITGKSELESVNILLNFVQTAFEYEYDEKLWGEDRSFFADESVYYPYCDCEDRSILFSRLVRDLTGLDVVLLYYPGHLAAAVRFNETVSGDYISYNDFRYTICDPTYINAPVGMTMPDMDNTKAFIVVL